MKTESLPPAFLAKAFFIAFVILIAGNLLSFWVLYADTFAPFSLPYYENFDQPMRLRYRQFGGSWRIQDATLQQSDVRSTDLLAVIPLTISAAQPYHFEAALQITNGPNGGGLLFNLQDPQSLQQSHLVRFGNDQGNDYLVFGYFDETMSFVSQGSVVPPDLSQGVRLAVDVHEENYDVLVNDQPVQRAIPLLYKGGNVALTTWFSAVSFDEIAVFAIDPQLPQAKTHTLADPQLKIENLAETDPLANNAVPPTKAIQSSSLTTSSNQQAFVVGEAASDVGDALATDALIAGTFTTTIDMGEQGLWQPFAGQWLYEQGKLVQTAPTGFDLGASRGGKVGEGEWSIRLLHRQGIGGGLLFGLPTPTSQNGGHMVRFFEDNSLAWGYFNVDGVFTGQGYAVIAPLGNLPHTLKVIVQQESYAVVLDGRVLVEAVPLQSKAGYVGVTASNSIVEFDEMLVELLKNQAS